VTALASLILAFERHGRDERTWNRTLEGILTAVVDAKLARARPSLRQIADAGDLPVGTVKSARSRNADFRQAMDAIGQGPLLLDRVWDEPDGATPLKRFAASRPQWEWSEWANAYGCRIVHRRMDADEPNSYETYDEWPDVPERAALERLWGKSARSNAELLDCCHRALTDPTPWMAEEMAGAAPSMSG
jgi:hypothetical protein